jgi:hypothetical protein
VVPPERSQNRRILGFMISEVYMLSSSSHIRLEIDIELSGVNMNDDEM